MNCPVCDKPLSAFNFNNIEVDVCKSSDCGIWFDYGELQDVSSSASPADIDSAFAGNFQHKDDNEERNEADKHCPRHSQIILDRYEWNYGSGIFLDNCSSCHGVWLDAGEVEGMTKMVDDFQKNPPELTPEMAAKLQAINDDVERKYSEAIEGAIGNWEEGTFADKFGEKITGNPNFDVRHFTFFDELMRTVLKLTTR